MSTFRDKVRAMNPEQVAAFLRTVGQVIGTIVATYGWIDEDTWTAAFGGIATTVLTIWGVWARSDVNLVKSAAAVPAVQAIVAPGLPAADDPNQPKVVASASQIDYGSRFA